MENSLEAMGELRHERIRVVSIVIGYLERIYSICFEQFGRELPPWSRLTKVLIMDGVLSEMQSALAIQY